ncbi:MULTISPECIES: NAD(P)H-binding protein [unclassified Nocardiopsis]|uniref:NAD(P)H-binding protein n=1 Tax=unclassified Nocardiopsis TaxID=2649073 RepID=UPI0013592064|nr:MULTISPECIES: NAD(P)H-binding protein [unclassified Nocardiopsis]
MTTYALTGATGRLGALVVPELLARGVAPSDLVAVVRDAVKAQPLVETGVQVRVADYDNPDALRTALAGVDRLLLISSSTVGHRAAQHANVIDAAKDSGVARIIYTSLLQAGEPGCLVVIQQMYLGFVSAQGA